MAVAGKAKIDSLGRQRKKLRAETWPLVSPNQAGGRAARRLIVTGGAAIICYHTVLYLAWGTWSTWGRVLPYLTILGILGVGPESESQCFVKQGSLNSIAGQGSC